MMQLPDPVEQAVSQTIGGVAEWHIAPGGSYSACKVTALDGSVAFCKYSPRACSRVFTSEAEGLRALAAVPGVRVPAVIAAEEFADSGFLLMEWLEITTTGDPVRLAEGLAAVHKQTSDRFGWADAGCLGRVSHPGGWFDDAATFYREARLKPYVEAARADLSGTDLEVLEKLADACVDIFRNVTRPVLVHGDLWGGNHGFLADGTPVLYDPSPAWAWPAYDLGFARSFGSFAPRFFEAYKQASGLDGPAFELQMDVSELLIMLVHVAMFGGGYVGRVRGLLQAIQSKL